MLTTEQIRRIAAQSGARDIEKVETDIILTHLLELFHEKKITDRVAFKGGTMLRKMIFGPRGRYSTDLDFTMRTGANHDQVMEMILDALGEPYQGLSFKLEDKDWYLTDDGFAANPVCSHAGNEKGIKIKIQVSTREQPVLPVHPMPQLQQEYFKASAGIFQGASVQTRGYSLSRPRGGHFRKNQGRRTALQNPRSSRSLADGKRQVRP
jgi:predicted nucleotidyltransferase component of viral defense system